MNPIIQLNHMNYTLLPKRRLLVNLMECKLCFAEKMKFAFTYETHGDLTLAE